MTLPRWLVPWVVVLGICFGVFDPRSDVDVIGLTPLGVALLDMGDAVVRFLSP